MKTRINAVSTAVASVALYASAFAGSAEAVTQDRQIVSLPTNFCQSSLPAFDGLIRKRPLAVQNEGSSTAFITCSYPSGEGRGTLIDSPTVRVWQYFVNSTDANITVSCTGVTGETSGLGTSQYIVKSLVVTPGSSSAQISWFAADFAGAPVVFPSQSQFSISCSIPPGAGLRQAYINSTTDVGS